MPLTSPKYKPVFLLLIHAAIASYAQNRSFEQSKLFARYLIDNKLYSEAKLELEGVDQKDMNQSQLDTLFYLQGSVLHKQKNYDSSSFCFNKVSDHSTYYHESKYIHTINMILLNRNDSALNILENIRYNSPTLHQPLLSFSKASLFLIKRDYPNFTRQLSITDLNYYPIAAECTELLKTYDDLIHKKKKYGAVAGLLSAVVPGSGKVYAGQYGQGLAGFVTVGLLAGSAAEIYFRSGPKNAQFAVMSTLFGMFYIGNIWGSVFSVKIYNEKYNEGVDKSIVLNMRIPVARIFN